MDTRGGFSQILTRTRYRTCPASKARGEAVKRYHTRKEKKNKNSSEYYSIRDFYEEHDASFKGPFTVPILYDRVEKKIVSNESSEIIRDLNERFQPLAKNDKLDLYPEKLR